MKFSFSFSLIKLYKIICKKIGLGVIILFNSCPFLSQLFTPTISFLNLDYICNKSLEFQKNLKHCKFW